MNRCIDRPRRPAFSEEVQATADRCAALEQFLLRAGDAFAGRPCTWRTLEVRSRSARAGTNTRRARIVAREPRTRACRVLGRATRCRRPRPASPRRARVRRVPALRHPRRPTVWLLTLRAPDTHREHAATGPLPQPVQSRRHRKAASLAWARSRSPASELDHVLAVVASSPGARAAGHQTPPGAERRDSSDPRESHGLCSRLEIACNINPRVSSSVPLWHC